MTQTSLTKPALALGIVKNTVYAYFVDFVQQTLQNKGINASIQYFETQADAHTAVIEGHIAIYACPLNSAPIILPMGLVITALSERKFVQNCLVIKNTEQKIVQKVGTFSDINCAQMLYLQPDYTVEKMNMTPIEGLEAVRSDVFDAVVLNSFDINGLSVNVEEFLIQPFSVRELIPSAGQGVMCFIVAEDDLSTRRLLKAVHHPSVSAVTNIERTVQKMLKNENVCAYCERDRMGNYHLWAAAWVNGVLHRTRVSQSTSFGMAEKVCEQLPSA